MHMCRRGLNTYHVGGGGGSMHVIGVGAGGCRCRGVQV
jgi:hypothetical protein